MVGAISDRLCRCCHALLITKSGTGGTDPGSYDQATPGLGQGADGASLLWRADDSVGPRGKGAAGALGHNLGHISRQDQRRIKVGAVERGQDRHGKYLQAFAAHAFPGCGNHVGVAVNGQEIKVIACDSAHRCLDRGANVEKLHVKEDALAMVLLQLIGKRETSAGQHPETDLVEADAVAQTVSEIQPCQRVRHVEGDDQTVIGWQDHGGVPVFHLARVCGFGPRLSSCAGHCREDAMKLEVCVDSVEGMLAAAGAGADRIELCSALEVGGLTPSAGQMARAVELSVPVHALIRSRAGDFRFNDEEVATMIADIGAARRAGLAGVVIGAADDAGRLDVPALEKMREAAGPMSVTLHRVFDLVPDFAEAVEAAVALGCDRILTSGGAVGAPEGAMAIKAIVGMADGRIRIMPGAGITSANVADLLSRVPVDEVHSACGRLRRMAARAVEMEFCHEVRLETDPAEVRALKAALGPFVRG